MSDYFYAFEELCWCSRWTKYFLPLPECLRAIADEENQ